MPRVRVEAVPQVSTFNPVGLGYQCLEPSCEHHKNPLFKVLSCPRLQIARSQSELARCHSHTRWCVRLFRLPSFDPWLYKALATITAIIVLGLCSSSTSAFHSVFGGLFNGQSLTYASIGIASGAMAVLTLPIMIFVDFINDGRTGLPILIEVPWLCVLWVMFLATGISTKNYVHDNWTVPTRGLATCNDIDPRVPEAKKICNEWEPIEIVSWISAGLLFLYSVTLLIISVVRAYGGKSMWGTSVKNSEI